MTIQPITPGIPQPMSAAEQFFMVSGQAGVLGQYPVGADAMVYMGPGYDTSTTIPKRGRRGNPGMFTTTEAKNVWFRMDMAEKERFVATQDTILGYKASDQQLQAAWNSTIDQLGAYQQQTGERISPWELAELAASRARPREEKAGAYQGPVTTFRRDENIDLTNPTTARQVLDNTLGQFLGRLPTEQEYKTFSRTLRAMEKEEPQIVESVSTMGPSGKPTQRITSKGQREGGVQPQQVATEFARSREDYAETQLSTTGLNAFLELLR